MNRALKLVLVSSVIAILFASLASAAAAAPAVSITSPTQNAAVASGVLNVSFTVANTSGTVSSRCALDNQTPVACANNGWQTTVTPGAHTISVTVSDSTGATLATVSIVAYEHAIARVSGGAIVYETAPGRASNVTTVPYLGYLVIQDTGLTIVSAGTGCEATGAANGVRCSLANITEARFTTSDLVDTFSINAGSLPVTVNGGTGNDTIRSTGTGADKLYGDSDSDTIYGGAGNDTVAGGPGADNLYGEGDADTLLADDGATDPNIVCGGQAGDTATVDLSPHDPTVTGCATVNRVDRIAPIVNITSPQPSSIHQVTSFTASFTLSDAQSGIASANCSIDQSPESLCQSLTGHTFSGLAPGKHTIRVSAWDNGGNTSMATREFYTWTQAVAYVSGSTLRFDAANGFANTVSAVPYLGSYVIQDTALASVVAGPGCNATGAANGVSCPGASITALRFASGDLSDSLSINAGATSVTIYGGSGADTLRSTGTGADFLYGEADGDKLYGGAGDDDLDGGTQGDELWGEGDNDDIFARDLFNDLVDCGAGAGDNARLDLSPMDPFTGCEIATRS